MPLIDNGRYETCHLWPNDCRVQGGSRGVVLGREPYTTAFVEAFPSDPPTFLRGEGPTMAEAEDAAWAKYVRVSAQDHVHEYETRGYRNGCGFCKHCNLFASGVFDLGEIGSVCVVCQVPTYWTLCDDKLYCEEHAPDRRERLAVRDRARAAGRDIPFGVDELFERLASAAED